MLVGRLPVMVHARCAFSLAFGVSTGVKLVDFLKGERKRDGRGDGGSDAVGGDMV